MRRRLAAAAAVVALFIVGLGAAGLLGKTAEGKGQPCWAKHGTCPTSTGTTSTGTTTTAPTTTTSTTASTTTTTTTAPPPAGLAARFGMSTPNVATSGWNLLWSQRIYADDGISLFRDTPGPNNVYAFQGAPPNWTAADRLVDFVQRVPGGKLLPTMTWSPQWQHPSCTVAPSWQCPPDPFFYQEWSNEVVATMDHLAARGLAVPEIEFWNEPWCCGFWLPRSSPAAYLALLRVLAPTVWAKYPAARILVSADYWQQGSTCSASPCPQWFQPLLDIDTTGLLNDRRIAFTTHNYAGAAAPAADRGTGWSFDRYKLARAQALAHGHPDPHLEITEYGWEANTGCVVFNDGVSEAFQATYTVDAAKMAFATGYVDKVFPHFDYGGSDTGCTGTAWGYNFHRADGTPRPVAAAVKSYIASG